MKHWSHRQRLIHRVSSSSGLSWKTVDELAKHYSEFIRHYSLIDYLLANYHAKIKKARELKNKPINRGHTFTSTVNQKQLSKAVRAMYQRKHGHYKLSINKICKQFHISKPSLYRGYRKKYKN